MEWKENAANARCRAAVQILDAFSTHHIRHGIRKRKTSMHSTFYSVRAARLEEDDSEDDDVIRFSWSARAHVSADHA